MSVQMIPGMAHFAGTGPDWTYCHECVHWRGKRPAHSNDSVGKGQCDKCARMLRRRSAPKVAGRTLACRHFEAAQ